jgi:hypothetical protein
METASMTTPFDAAAVDIANTVNRLKEYAYDRIQVNYDEALRARRMESKYEKMYIVARNELVDAKAKVSELTEALTLRDKGVEMTLKRIDDLETALAARDRGTEIALARIAELEAALAARDDALVKIAELEEMLLDDRRAKRPRHDPVADATFDHVVVRNGSLYYQMSDEHHPPTDTALRIVERYRCRDSVISGTYSMYYLRTPEGNLSFRSKKAAVKWMTGVPNYPPQA